MKKIVFIVPYFGKFPEEFNLWLTSCGFNEKFNWIIFTDDHRPFNYPSNVKVVYTTFEETKALYQSKFDFSIALENPYKLCDYKPAYGHLYEDYIKDYDFWGHCDIDLIWGDLEKFITPEILSRYDKVFARGHCILYRNNNDVNVWYKTLGESNGIDYKTVYTSNYSYAFDEGGGSLNWGGMNKLVKIKNKKYYHEAPFDDICVQYYNFVSGRDFDVDKNSFKKPVAYEYNRGSLFKVMLDKNNVIKKYESMYVHFQKRNMKVMVDDVNKADKFIMIPNKFLDWKEIDHEILLNDCKHKLLYIEFLKLRYKNLLKKIKRIIGKLGGTNV